MFFFFKQKTAYEMRISDWSSDVCSSDLSEISIPERSERVFLRELMDGGRRRVRAHGALNGRVREIAVDEGRGQAAQFPGGIDAAHSKRRNARNAGCPLAEQTAGRSEEHTSELQSLMRNAYAVFCCKKKKEI